MHEVHLTYTFTHSTRRGAAGAAIAAPVVGAAPAAAKITMLPVSSLTIGQRTDIIKELQVRRHCCKLLLPLSDALG